MKVPIEDLPHLIRVPIGKGCLLLLTLAEYQRHFTGGYGGGAGDLVFKGLDLCDGCGAPLTPGERLSGLSQKCARPPAKPDPKPRPRGDR